MRHVQTSPAHRLGREAAGLELVLVLATVTLVAKLGPPTPVEQGDWLDFAILLPLVAVAHLLGADRAKHQGSQLSLAPFFTAVLVLPPSLFVLLIAVAFVPEWLRTRSGWHIALFNLCNYVGPALLARAVFDAVDGGSAAGWTLGAVAAIASFLVLHHGLLAAVLRLARGVGLRDTVRFDCVLLDAGLPVARRDRGSSLDGLSRARRADASADGARVPLARDPRSSRRPGSSPRPGSTTSAISRPPWARSWAAPPGSTARWRCS